ncbi:MAG TPA: carboxypeptidase-like regulatory domain-containing protein [Bacteroidia bacterium]|jgi:hypothetical protein|nr:carboxypeptidase-like regulatory domain-containing protein [Bacteroidia bacterium]
MKNIYKQFTAIAFLLTLFSCSKPDTTNNTPFSGTNLLQGKVYYIDPTTTTVPSVLKKGTIYISTGTDTSHIFFSVVTDTTGYYSIPYLRYGNYTVFARFFNGQKNFYGINNTINITNKNNAMSQVVDGTFSLYSLASGNGVLQGYVYYVDSSLNTITPVILKKQMIYLKVLNGGKINLYNTTTDSTGFYRFSILPISSDTIFASYFNGAKTFKGKIDTTVKTSNENVILKPLYLSYQKPFPGPALTLLFKDKTGGFMSNLSFRVYSDSTLASVDSARYAVFKATSDSVGSYSITNLPLNMTYYIVSHLKITKIDSIHVDTTLKYFNPYTTYTVVLRH